MPVSLKIFKQLKSIIIAKKHRQTASTLSYAPGGTLYSH